MDDFFNEIMKAYKKEYGEDAAFEDGETQVFELNDCTVILSLDDGEIKFHVIGDKPIKVDYTSGLYEGVQEKENE